MLAFLNNQKTRCPGSCNNFCGLPSVQSDPPLMEIVTGTVLVQHGATAGIAQALTVAVLSLWHQRHQSPAEKPQVFDSVTHHHGLLVLLGSCLVGTHNVLWPTTRNKWKRGMIND